MIKVIFFSEKEKISGFEISGHSGSAEKGQDIVCSAVSSASIMAANTITDVIGAAAEVKVDEGYLFFRLNNSSEAQDVLKGLEVHIRELSLQYPDYVTIIYESNSNGGN